MQLSVLTGTWQMSEISDSVKTLAKNGRNECNREFLAKSENAPVLRGCSAIAPDDVES